MDDTYKVKVIEDLKDKKMILLEGINDHVQLVISKECFYTNHIVLNQSVDANYIDKVKACDYYLQIMQKAFALIKKKDYSTSKLKNLLMEKYNDETAVLNVLAQLKSMNYLDDDKYVKNYLDRAVSKRYGYHRIIEDLKANGLNYEENMIKNYLAEVEFKNGVAEAEVYLKKYAKKDPQKIKRSIFTRLSYLGYEQELIEKVMTSLKLTLNEDPN